MRARQAGIVYKKKTRRLRLRVRVFVVRQGKTHVRWLFFVRRRGKICLFIEACRIFDHRLRWSRTQSTEIEEARQCVRPQLGPRWPGLHLRGHHTTIPFARPDLFYFFFYSFFHLGSQCEPRISFFLESLPLAFFLYTRCLRVVCQPVNFR